MRWRIAVVLVGFVAQVVLSSPNNVPEAITQLSNILNIANLLPGSFSTKQPEDSRSSSVVRQTYFLAMNPSQGLFPQRSKEQFLKLTFEKKLGFGTPNMGYNLNHLI